MLRALFAVIVVVFGAAAAATYFAMFIVHQNEQAIVLEFGKPVTIINEPGLYWKVPVVQTVAEATGQTARFLKVYEEYKKAPEVTRKRMYLETMERVLGGTDKIILDNRGGPGVVPFLPLDQLPSKKSGGSN